MSEHPIQADFFSGNRLISAVGEELKAPLGLISGLSAELLATAPSTRQKQRQYLERIRYSSDRMLGLIDSIMLGYEVNQQALELRLEPINPVVLMEEVAHELAPHARRQAQLVAVVSRQRRILLADQHCLRAVLFNLLDNAIKYSKPETTIELESRLRAGRPQIVIKDFGPGMKRSDLKRLLGQFGRVKRPVPEWATTTGLGLYVAKQLVEAMQGSMELTRRKSGTSFLVNLQPSRQLSLLGDG